MKRVIALGMLLFLAGCSSKYYLQPVSVCQPLSAYRTIIVSPIDTDTTYVEEKRYRTLPPSIAAEISYQFKERLAQERLYLKVEESAACKPNAIRLDTQFSSLVHHGGSFHVDLHGYIIDCQNNEAVFKYGFERVDGRDVYSLARTFARDVVNGIKERWQCK